MFHTKNKELVQLASKIEELLETHNRNKFELNELIHAIGHKEKLFQEQVEKFNTNIKLKEEELVNIEQKLLKDIEFEKEKLKIKELALNEIYSEKSKGFPWLASTIAEFHKYFDYEIANYLERKKHPAYEKALQIREIADENKLIRKELKIVKSYINYYETLFPWLSEYRNEDLDELLAILNKSDKIKAEDDFDPVLLYIPKAEYDNLSEIDRNQKALDRYMNSRKSPWQIGRDYERYIGYQYETKGYKVSYFGIENGLEDLGRDLICVKGEEIHIVQCKYWNTHKTIHEKHINQLYGTTVKYYIDHILNQQTKNEFTLFPNLLNNNRIKAIFVTSTQLSATALKFANVLGIKVYQEKPLEKYPLIKCNISSKGDKIYHLPFDQQYDKTLINSKGEFYAFTVQEATQQGFRRAYKWKGN